MTNKEFYTQNGWKGSNYERGLSVPDIAKKIRAYIKKAHCTYKFSVTSDCNSINIALMEYPIELTNYELMKKEVEKDIRKDEWLYIPSLDKNIRGSDITEEQKEEHIRHKLSRTAADGRSLNHYYLNDIKWINPVILEVLKDIYSFTSSYNYDDSDIATDYFDKNFYVQLAIGKYEKPAKLVERTARISPTKKVKDAKLLTA